MREFDIKNIILLFLATIIIISKGIVIIFIHSKKNFVNSINKDINFILFAAWLDKYQA